MGPGRRGAALVMTAPRLAPDPARIVSMRNSATSARNPLTARRSFQCGRFFSQAHAARSRTPAPRTPLGRRREEDRVRRCRRARREHLHRLSRRKPCRAAAARRCVQRRSSLLAGRRARLLRRGHRAECADRSRDLHRQRRRVRRKPPDHRDSHEGRIRHPVAVVA